MMIFPVEHVDDYAAQRFKAKAQLWAEVAVEVAGALNASDKKVPGQWANKVVEDFEAYLEKEELKMEAFRAKESEPEEESGIYIPDSGNKIQGPKI